MSVRKKVVVFTIICAVAAVIAVVVSYCCKRPVYDSYSPYFEPVNAKYGDAFRVSNVWVMDGHIDVLCLKAREAINTDEYTELCIAFYNDMVKAFGEKSSLTNYHVIVFENKNHDIVAFRKFGFEPSGQINYICDFSLFENVDDLASVCIYALYIDKSEIFALKDEDNEYSFKILVDMDSDFHY